MRVAALDLGTNTFLLLIAEVEPAESAVHSVPGTITKVLHDEVQVIRLGQGVNQSREFHPEALARAEKCFRDYSKTIQDYKVDKILACATSAARDVKNGHLLIESATRYGIPIEIISGEREAELTFLGTIDKSEGPVRIIDVGGGSTEYIGGVGTKLNSRVSVDIGSVRLTEKFVTRHPVPADEISLMKTEITKQIAKGLAAFNDSANTNRAEPVVKVIAVAGTPTTLATIEQGLAFESERVQGFRLKTSRLKYWVDRLASLSVEERQALAGMEPKRADVIVAGALILLTSAEMMNIDEMEVSIKGLRYGIARSLAQATEVRS